jgi:RNA polymerase sigma factor (sigma-70 family)
MAVDLKGQAAPLHPEDLALAQACARGDTDAWDRFVVEYRPILYRAADAIDRTGTARELADALYAELFGLKEQDGESQRYVDRIRATRRLEELPDEETHLRQGSGGQANPMSARAAATDPDASRFGAAMQDALRATIAALEPRDRLRLGCYYAQEMTLVQIGKLTRESEATVSRQLARTRRGIKDEVERRLRDRHRFGDREVAECLASVVEDAGELDLAAMLGPRKKPAVDRSKVGGLR